MQKFCLIMLEAPNQAEIITKAPFLVRITLNDVIISEEN